MGTRAESLVTEAASLTYRNMPGGVLMDAFEIVAVLILNPDYQQVATIPGSAVTRTDLGAYSVSAPGNLFSVPGVFHDVWQVRQVDGGGLTSYTYDINVVNAASPSATNFSAVLNVTLENLDACMLKQKYLWPVAACSGVGVIGFSF